MIEYLDFQCPHCRSAEQPISQVLEAYSGEVSLEARHFPISDLHPFAELAAMASEAAGNQGRFWEMHDLLFERQEHLGPGLIQDIAVELSLDLQRFNRDLQDPELMERVRADIREGEESGVDSTPTVYVNGEILEGPVTFVALSRAVAHFLSMNTSGETSGKPGQSDAA